MDLIKIWIELGIFGTILLGGVAFLFFRLGSFLYLQINEKSKTAYFDLANSSFSRKNYVSAMLLYKKSLGKGEIDPKYIRYSLGLCCIELRDYKGAAAEFDRASKSSPDYFDASILMFRCLYELGSADEAKEGLKKMLEEQPRLSEAHTCLGNIYFSESQYTDAIRHFELSRRERTVDSEVLVNLGVCYYLIDEIDFARKCLEEAQIRGNGRAKVAMERLAAEMTR